jgi:hypothetical protein
MYQIINNIMDITLLLLQISEKPKVLMVILISIQIQNLQLLIKISETKKNLRHIPLANILILMIIHIFTQIQEHQLLIKI